MRNIFQRADAGVNKPEILAYRLIVFPPKMISDPITKLRAEYPDAKVEFLDAHTFMALTIVQKC